jgi:hypothetical protein
LSLRPNLTLPTNVKWAWIVSYKRVPVHITLRQQSIAQ